MDYEKFFSWLWPVITSGLMAMGSFKQWKVSQEKENAQQSQRIEALENRYAELSATVARMDGTLSTSLNHIKKNQEQILELLLNR